MRQAPAAIRRRQRANLSKPVTRPSHARIRQARCALRGRRVRSHCRFASARLDRFESGLTPAPAGNPLSRRGRPDKASLGTNQARGGDVFFGTRRRGEEAIGPDVGSDQTSQPATIPNTQAAIAMVDAHPSQRSHPPIVNWPMTLRCAVISIITVITGTATTPLITALQ